MRLLSRLRGLVAPTAFGTVAALTVSPASAHTPAGAAVLRLLPAGIAHSSMAEYTTPIEVD